MNALKPCVMGILLAIFQQTYAQTLTHLLVLTHATQSTGQRYTVHPGSFPQDKVRKFWTEGYRIQEVSYGAESWTMVFTDDSTYQDQRYLIAPVFPEEFIRANWKEGFHLSSLTYGAGEWCAILNRQDTSIQQRLFASQTIDTTFIRLQASEGYFLTDVAMAYQEVHMVFSQDSNRAEQLFYVGKTYPKELLTVMVADGKHRVTHFSYQNNHWLLCMAEDQDFRGQEWYLMKAFPKNTIAGGWASGFLIHQFQQINYGKEQSKPLLAAKGIAEAPEPCKGELSAVEMTELARNVYNFPDEPTRYTYLSHFLNQNPTCLGNQQITTLNQMVQSDAYRYQLFLTIQNQVSPGTQLADYLHLFNDETFRRKFEKLFR
ncbi:MAG: hypothetical protein AAGI38_20270 [Bacteroidota bacterium]